MKSPEGKTQPGARKTKSGKSEDAPDKWTDEWMRTIGAYAPQKPTKIIDLFFFLNLQFIGLSSVIDLLLIMLN